MSLSRDKIKKSLDSKQKLDYEKEKGKIGFGVGVAEEDWVIEDAGM